MFHTGIIIHWRSAVNGYFPTAASHRKHELELRDGRGPLFDQKHAAGMFAEKGAK